MYMYIYIYIYISKDLNYKVTKLGVVYKSIRKKKLGSIFVEVLSRSYKNNCRFIYKHPIVVVAEFHDSYLQPLLDKLADVILKGDVNMSMSMLHYEIIVRAESF